MPVHRAVGDLQMRWRAYWALFAGAHGLTYGTHPIWQMYAPGREPLWDVHTAWYDAMDLPGANQLRYLKALLFSRPFLKRIPDQTVVYSGFEEGLSMFRSPGMASRLETMPAISWPISLGTVLSRSGPSAFPEKVSGLGGLIHVAVQLSVLATLPKRTAGSSGLQPNRIPKIGCWCWTMPHQSIHRP